MFSLCYKTPIEWVHTVLADFDVFLCDHAACERKASSMAMSMLLHYSDKPELVSAMADLALEEMHHFKQVLNYILQRNLVLPKDTPDPYVNQLRKHIKNGKEDYFLDRLLLGSIIEARGYERFDLIAKALPESNNLKKFYMAIAKSEYRHYELFLNLAENYFEKNKIFSRLDQWLSIEADIIKNLPHRPALH